MIQGISPDRTLELRIMREAKAKDRAAILGDSKLKKSPIVKLTPLPSSSHSANSTPALSQGQVAMENSQDTISHAESDYILPPPEFSVLPESDDSISAAVYNSMSPTSQEELSMSYATVVANKGSPLPSLRPQLLSQRLSQQGTHATATSTPRSNIKQIATPCPIRPLFANTAYPARRQSLQTQLSPLYSHPLQPHSHRQPKVATATSSRPLFAEVETPPRLYIHRNSRGILPSPHASSLHNQGSKSKATVKSQFALHPAWHTAQRVQGAPSGRPIQGTSPRQRSLNNLRAPYPFRYRQWNSRPPSTLKSTAPAINPNQCPQNLGGIQIHPNLLNFLLHMAMPNTI